MSSVFYQEITKGTFIIEEFSYRPQKLEPLSMKQLSERPFDHPLECVCGRCHPPVDHNWEAIKPRRMGVHFNGPDMNWDGILSRLRARNPVIERIPPTDDVSGIKTVDNISNENFTGEKVAS
jgi:hypothetical protein